MTPINVSATAEIAGDGLVCVIGLMPRDDRASIHLDNNAVLRAGNCGVYSNSPSKYGLRVDGDSAIYAGTICSAGGILRLGYAKFSPEPITDCPTIDDPLIERLPPPVSSCRETALVIKEDTVLNPGTYCSGLTITDDAKVTLKPGVYVIKDGPLIVTDEGRLLGKHVAFYLTGQDSIFEFHENSEIDLIAPKTGPLAGLLVYEDRNVPYSFDFNPFFMKTESITASFVVKEEADEIEAKVRMHMISSNNARQLLGTIYLPNSILLINSTAPVADESAYTAIVTARLWLQQGPTLTLNADYAATEVPVPGSLLGSKIRLTK